MDSGREQNYWPAFVDALSNVVLTLVFVLIIFVFALVIESQKVAQKLQEVTEKSSGANATQNEEALKQQIAQLSEQLAEIRQQSVASLQNQDQQIVVKDSDPTKPNEGPVNIQNIKDGIVLKFPITVAQMDQQSQDKFGHVLDALQKTTGKHKIIMRSYLGKETYSVAQRLAYYRAIGARNYLIQKLGESPDSISISIVSPPQPQDGRVEIILEKQ